MLYLVSGNLKERKEHINKIIVSHDGEPSKAMRINMQDIDEEVSLSDLVITQSGLFESKEFYILSSMARDLPLKDILQEYMESPNVMIFSEDSIIKKIRESFSGCDATIIELEQERTKSNDDFNIFSLADDFGTRDKKKLWISYREAISKSTAESINGILLWQLRNMIMVVLSKNTPAGMSEFVYKKSLRFSKNYNIDELRYFTNKLTHAYHNRDTFNTLEVQIEKIILSL